MKKQVTIAGKVVLEGVGLHTGKEAKLEFLPAPPNSGIFFLRKDLPDQVMIKADYYNVVEPHKFPRRTSVGMEGVYVHTIEHLMAALSILGIDNLQINIWGEEIPGMDGSAKAFVEALESVGRVEQEAYKRYITIREPLWIEEDNSSLTVLPSTDFRISYTLKYNNPLINTRYIDLILDGSLKGDIYKARTFCLEEEVKSLLEMGLGKGSNYENTLVVAKDRIIDNELRIEDEFVKHKVLDLLGDLYLAGPLKGHIIAIKSGHTLNIKLVKKIKEYQRKATSGGVSSFSSYLPASRELSVEEIMKILPHRYPFLLIDRILYLDPGKRAVGIKNITINDYFFKGHFPNRPVMPGVLIIEAMAQVGGVLMLASEENRGKLAYFMAANGVKFRRTVEPGDQLVIEVVAGKIKSKTGIVYTKAFVDNKLTAEAELMFTLVES
ncbi:MAG: 3-hydroxyacyl-[acyl-carrier-protein] dehydratase FabZ [Candidatus Omnitrophota bacterium]|nr:MAG: 3-hydroxyacyl-[acyl-carrier-protein] dehydratase FabZ [Candidatus Omnitrophota bacterium]RKY45718.1 MAG: 3-hydroxyacyl-[acyl-carrier-protein] dehydratase FabZ [Candidatus Omnitrophota bacterium]HDN86296.1 UDP-3-O-[3-hydroxymyristoyl] N-acetylglucosamine deacetylase [Candidatus Omnitrophota bacterium]